MRIYEIHAFCHAPEGTSVDERAISYQNIVGRTDDDAIAEAKTRHMKGCLRMKGVEFKIAGSRIVLCPTALPEAA